MKIQHFAIIFLMIMIPFSVICRNVINNKNYSLRDEIRYNNIVDNATYDAVSQLKEFSEYNNAGKNLRINDEVALATVKRFFSSMAVNFNLPTGTKSVENYFQQYIPAVIIVGYDGLYVYSCEATSNGYQFQMKPKIPYAEAIGSNVINYTLDNYVTIYCKDYTFKKGLEDSVTKSKDGTHFISGYVGEILDTNGDGLDDRDSRNPEIMRDPYYILRDPFTGSTRTPLSETNGQIAIVKNTVADETDNISYLLYALGKVCNSGGVQAKTANLNFLISRDGNVNFSTPINQVYDFTPANQDYEFDVVDGHITGEASLFHQKRRQCIVDTISGVLKEEFNEHNNYAKSIGITYQFSIPTIGRDEINNTINDISVLSFIQGIPIGYNTYYNKYSLGGTRIVARSDLFAETVKVSYSGKVTYHRVYHKSFCKFIPHYANGEVVYNLSLIPANKINTSIDHFDPVTNQFIEVNDGSKEYNIYNNRIYSHDGIHPATSLIYYGDGTYYRNGTVNTEYLFPNGQPRVSTGIEQTFINQEDAKAKRYYPCSECIY